MPAGSVSVLKMSLSTPHPSTSPSPDPLPESANPEDRPSLLRLPLEIRHLIYSNLTPLDPVSYPFPQSPITSISHRSPPRSLLLTNHQLSAEVRSYYYGVAVFRFLGMAGFSVISDDISPGSVSAVRNMRKVELMILWNLTKERLRADQSTWPYFMSRWLEDIVSFLRKEATELKVLIVSVRDVGVGGKWKKKKALLEALESLRGRVKFLVGEIVVVGGEEQEVRGRLGEYLKELNGDNPHVSHLPHLPQPQPPLSSPYNMAYRPVVESRSARKSAPQGCR
ncbi:hypothetical protein BCR34DRAFT_581296 [Clohesyomyces aquaticus]|uniref:F-box domain-containing protein n=1 Tax=Clohesyomyces aquaticus TaxID=1231657 RepID=A0A1Y1Y1U2_9PLEO|nr:hypothetical protein BCR34DRAFT_581296 [Clohesyomyces aquaticus]